MVNYQLGKIYKIVCNETGEQYIGSTVQKMLCTRLAHHVSKHNKTTSRTIIDRGNYEICLIENYPCSSKDELHMRERFFIETLDNCVNKYIPGRTETEKIEQTKEQKKDYYDENKVEILKKHKNYYVNNRGQILKQKKEYDIKHRDNKLEYDKEYRLKNREILNKKQREQRQAKKLTQEEHRADRREYWANLKESQKVSLSPTE